MLSLAPGRSCMHAGDSSATPVGPMARMVPYQDGKTATKIPKHVLADGRERALLRDNTTLNPGQSGQALRSSRS
jgi:hypothetical protein